MIVVLFVMVGGRDVRRRRLRGGQRRPAASRRISQDRKSPTPPPSPGSTTTSTSSTPDTDYWTRCARPGCRRARRRSTSRAAPTPAPLADDPRLHGAVHDRAAPGAAASRSAWRTTRPRDRPRDGHAAHPRDRAPERHLLACAARSSRLPPRLVPGLPLLHGLRDARPGRLPDDRLAEQHVGGANCKRPARAPARTAARRSSSGASTRSTARSTPTTTSRPAGTPVFGRSGRRLDRGLRPVAGLGEPRRELLRRLAGFSTPLASGADPLKMPPTNAKLATAAQSRLPVHRQDRRSASTAAGGHDGDEPVQERRRRREPGAARQRRDLRQERHRRLASSPACVDNISPPSGDLRGGQRLRRRSTSAAPTPAT